MDKSFNLFIGSAPNLLRFIPQHLIMQSQPGLRHNAKSLGHHNFATENGILQSIHPHCNNMNYRTGFQVSANECQYYWCSYFIARCSPYSLLRFLILVGWVSWIEYGKYGCCGHVVRSKVLSLCMGLSLGQVSAVLRYCMVLLVFETYCNKNWAISIAAFVHST
jgi:hypothetical protein